MSARADLLPGVLSGIRVIDMAQGRAGALCAQLLAEAGAEVVRVEPAAGDPTRGTVAFASWNRSKAAAAIDWRGEGRPALAALLAGADVLIHDLPPADALRHGLNAAALAVTAPALSLCTIGSYPEGHADEAMPHDDFLVLASAGILDEQQPARRDGPVYLAFPLASCGATWLATIGIAARLYAMGGGGHPGPVATSLLQGGLAQVMTHWRLAETPSPSLAAGWPKTFRNSVFECADGV
ncbi:MAG: putative acyl-CoA transferase/carnitine dehydratase, partial [Caulobacter sp.]|nr:putative acyl-CoA transferase/carnitine dehydratase [Caulobacter sp.]